MISHLNKRFRKAFALLPFCVQKLARKNYLLWKENPWHPSLNFEELIPGLWSVRVGDHYRVLGAKQPDGSIVWTWIGTHEAYNKLIRR